MKVPIIVFPSNDRWLDCLQAHTNHTFTARPKKGQDELPFISIRAFLVWGLETAESSGPLM